MISKRLDEGFDVVFFDGVKLEPHAHVGEQVTKRCMLLTNGGCLGGVHPLEARQQKNLFGVDVVQKRLLEPGPSHLVGGWVVAPYIAKQSLEERVERAMVGEQAVTEG